jgi:hypothetical protein
MITALIPAKSFITKYIRKDITNYLLHCGKPQCLMNSMGYYCTCNRIYTLKPLWNFEMFGAVTIPF